MSDKYVKIFDEQVDIYEIPVEYCWSGYVKNKEEFEKENFYVWFDNDKKNIICSDENAVALGDYISNYLLKSDIIYDMESIFCPGYNQWFFLAWEQCLTSLEDFPEWIKDIFNVLIESGIISILQNEEKIYYYILDVEKAACDDILSQGGINDQIEKCCTKNANEYWKGILEQEDELIEPECGEWGMSIYKKFVEGNVMVEISAWCSSSIGPGVGFGIAFHVCDVDEEDDSWIYEGMGESIAENWEEFEDVAEQTKEECLKYYRENNIIPATRGEVEKLAKEILKQKMGEYDISFEVEPVDFEISYEFSSEEISDAVYGIVCGNFAIDYCVFNDIINE